MPFTSYFLEFLNSKIASANYPVQYILLYSNKLWMLSYLKAKISSVSTEEKVD